MFSLPSVVCRMFVSGFSAGVVLSFRWVPSELNYSDNGSVSSTVIMTRANHFMFLRNAHHDFLMRRQATNNVLLRHRCSWTMVKFIVNLL